MTFVPDSADLTHVFSHNMSESDVDILFVSDQPERDAFINKNKTKGRFFKVFLQLEAQTRSTFRRKWILNYDKEPPESKRLFAFLSNRWLGSKPSHEDLAKESKDLLQLIVNRYNPKLIVALGKSVSKILGIDRPIKVGRNQIYDIHLNGIAFKMLPTFGFSDLSAKFKYETHMRLDFLKAFESITKLKQNMSGSILKEEIKLHRYYRTLAQVEAFYAWYKKSNFPYITIDFETTGLKYYKPDERIIMAAIGLGNKCAVTILLDHKEHPEPHNLPKIWGYVKAILEDSTVGKINHNIKFDYQMAKKHPYNITITNIVWCTQLAEHLCFEDKSEAYSLDSLTSEYEPIFTNYKSMIAPETKELDQLMLALEEEESSYQALVEQWKNRKDRWEIQKTFDKQESIDAEVMYLHHKKTYEKQLLQWNQDIEQYTKELASWKALSKDEKGPRPKKPAKPKMSHKKPTAKAFKERKPIKSDRHKHLETRISELKSDKKNKTYEDVDLSVLEVYAAIDADLTYRIYEKQKVYLYQEHERFIEDQTNFYLQYVTFPLPQGYERPDLSMLQTSQYRETIKGYLRKIYPSTLDLMRNQVRFMPETIGTMEMNGSSLDYQRVETMYHEMEDLQQKALADIQYYAQRSNINPNSDQEMLTLLNTFDFEKILADKNLPREYTAKTGALSLKAEYFEKWQVAFEKLDNPCAKVFKSLANYRKAHKCKDTYLGNYLEYGKIDGRIHTEFFIYGTSGARLSSGKPNLQNIPKKSNMLGIDVKKLFVPTIIEGDTHVYSSNTTHH